MRYKLSLIGCMLLLQSCALDGIINSSGTIFDANMPPAILAASDKRMYIKALEGIKKRRFRKAEVILNKLIKKYPGAAGPLANKGVIYAKRNKLNKAQALFEQALKENEKLVQVRNHLAVIYRKKGKFTEAKEMLDAAIVTDPYYANAYYNLGILYELYFQMPKKALENYQLYLDLTKRGNKQASQWVSSLQRKLKRSK